MLLRRHLIGALASNIDSRASFFIFYFLISINISINIRVNQNVKALRNKIKIIQNFKSVIQLSVHLGNVFCSVRHCSHVLSVGPTDLLQTNEKKRRPTA